MTPRLVGIATGVRLSQVGHAARVGVHVLPVAATGPASVRVVPGGAALHAGLAGVGRAVVQNLGAAAALGRGEHQGRHASFRFRRELGLRLQTTAALAEILRGILTPGITRCFFKNRISPGAAGEAELCESAHLRWELLKALRVSRGVGGMLRASRGCLETSLNGLSGPDKASR